jgi:GTP-binding protein EngB required for normal cell division
MDYSELENRNEKLDDDWINKFEKVDELYKDFYKDNVYFVDLKGFGDISYHYEQNGGQAITELLKSRKKIDFIYKLKRILN